MADVAADAVVQAGVVQGGIQYYGRSRPQSIGDFSAPSSPETGWLLEQPSCLLGVRSQVVPFVGRETELRRLKDWLDPDRDRVSVLLLHGPGSQGKTQIAYGFAERSRSSRNSQNAPRPRAGASTTASRSCDGERVGARGEPVRTTRRQQRAAFPGLIDT